MFREDPGIYQYLQVCFRVTINAVGQPRKAYQDNVVAEEQVHYEFCDNAFRKLFRKIAYLSITDHSSVASREPVTGVAYWISAPSLYPRSVVL